MSTELVITGTGAPNPAPGRAGPGAMVRIGDVVLQFDAGRSTVERLVSCDVRPPQVTAFFGTHHHSDHMTAFADLVMTRWILGGDDLPVVVPEGPLVDLVEHMLDCWQLEMAERAEHLGRELPRVDVRPFIVPTAPTEVWSDGDVRVLASEVRHEPLAPAVGFRVETPDGVIVISGDTRVCDEMRALADGADVLVHEALRVELVEQIPPLRFIIHHHADTRALGAQVAELGIPTLVLTHLIPAPATSEERVAFEADVRAGGFEGRVIVADDLDAVVL